MKASTPLKYVLKQKKVLEEYRVTGHRHLYIVFRTDRGKEKVIGGRAKNWVESAYTALSDSYEAEFLIEIDRALMFSNDSPAGTDRYPMPLYCGAQAKYIWEIMVQHAESAICSNLNYNITGLSKSKTALNSNTLVQYILYKTHEDIDAYENYSQWHINTIYPEFSHPGLDDADLVYISDECKNGVQEAIDSYTSKFNEQSFTCE